MRPQIYILPESSQAFFNYVFICRFCRIRVPLSSTSVGCVREAHLCANGSSFVSGSKRWRSPGPGSSQTPGSACDMLSRWCVESDLKCRGILDRPKLLELPSIVHIYPFSWACLPDISVSAQRPAVGSDPKLLNNTGMEILEVCFRYVGPGPYTTKKA